MITDGAMESSSGFKCTWLGALIYLLLFLLPEIASAHMPSATTTSTVYPRTLLSVPKPSNTDLRSVYISQTAWGTDTHEQLRRRAPVPTFPFDRDNYNDINNDPFFNDPRETSGSSYRYSRHESSSRSEIIGGTVGGLVFLIGVFALIGLCIIRCRRRRRYRTPDPVPEVWASTVPPPAPASSWVSPAPAPGWVHAPVAAHVHAPVHVPTSAPAPAQWDRWLVRPVNAELPAPMPMQHPPPSQRWQPSQQQRVPTAELADPDSLPHFREPAPRSPPPAYQNSGRPYAELQGM